MSQAKPTPRAATYVWLLPKIIERARKLGYAIGLHGSMNRDLDLMAMPWVEEAAPPEDLVEAIREYVDGVVHRSGTPAGKYDPETKEFIPTVIRNPASKPHGRRAWNIHFGQIGLYIDLSVMPRWHHEEPEPENA